MQNIIKYLFLTAIIIACIIMGWYFRSIFFFMAISAVLSLITRPIFDLFKRIHLGKFSVSNGIAALITVFIIWSVIIVFFRYTIPLVGGELQYLSSVDINLTFDRVSVLFSEALEPFRQKNDALALSIESQIREAAIALFDITKIKSSFSGMLNFVGGFVIAAFSITFVTFFF
jgi:predicted PurR-regulated permease PerM